MAQKSSNLSYETDVNKMGFNQLANTLNEIVGQATGSKGIAPVNESEFISVAQTALYTGYDPIINSISQTLSKTIFSIRPYEQKFKSINVDNLVYGNHVRKLQEIDTDWEDDNRLELVDGQSIDMYNVKKPKIKQTNFYGENVCARHKTIFKDQLDTAFTGSQQFGSFLSMIMQNAADMITQKKEVVARATVSNLIGGTIDLGNSNQVINLVDAYNADTGTDYTADTILNNDNFPNFVRWLYGFINTISDYLTERSSIYHAAIGDGIIQRHTPKMDQRLFLYSKLCRLMESIVSSTTYHDDKLVFPNYEPVNYWQAIEDPMAIDVIPSIVDKDGVASEGDEVNAQVVGVLFDREAMGITTVNEWSGVTPFNVNGGYYNQYWHFTERFWNDFSENCIVFILK